MLRRLAQMLVTLVKLGLVLYWIPLVGGPTLIVFLYIGYLVICGFRYLRTKIAYKQTRHKWRFWKIGDGQMSVQTKRLTTTSLWMIFMVFV